MLFFFVLLALVILGLFLAKHFDVYRVWSKYKNIFPVLFTFVFASIATLLYVKYVEFRARPALFALMIAMALAFPAIPRVVPRLRYNMEGWAALTFLVFLVSYLTHNRNGYENVPTTTPYERVQTSDEREPGYPMNLANFNLQPRRVDHVFTRKLQIRPSTVEAVYQSIGLNYDPSYDSLRTHIKDYGRVSDLEIGGTMLHRNGEKKADRMVLDTGDTDVLYYLRSIGATPHQEQLFTEFAGSTYMTDNCFLMFKNPVIRGELYIMGNKYFGHKVYVKMVDHGHLKGYMHVVLETAADLMGGPTLLSKEARENPCFLGVHHDTYFPPDRSGAFIDTRTVTINMPEHHRVTKIVTDIFLRSGFMLRVVQDTPYDFTRKLNIVPSDVDTVTSALHRSRPSTPDVTYAETHGELDRATFLAIGGETLRQKGQPRSSNHQLDLVAYLSKLGATKHQERLFMYFAGSTYLFGGVLQDIWDLVFEYGLEFSTGQMVLQVTRTPEGLLNLQSRYTGAISHGHTYMPFEIEHHTMLPPDERTAFTDHRRVGIHMAPHDPLATRIADEMSRKGHVPTGSGATQN